MLENNEIDLAAVQALQKSASKADKFDDTPGKQLKKVKGNNDTSMVELNLDLDDMMTCGKIETTPAYKKYFVDFKDESSEEETALDRMREVALGNQQSLELSSIVGFLPDPVQSTAAAKKDKKGH